MASESKNKKEIRFKPLEQNPDFPKKEEELLKKWYEEKVVERYLHLNDSSKKQFSFLDGPITANNPMGVHHAWGRTYKDLWQRFFNLRGFKQRFQNGFDEQGLWVEVEVEKELGLRNKKDIENLVPGDKFKSLEKFINLCKARVQKYSAIQTDQSIRLGYFMDWDNSYHTSSDNNNYEIWNFLKIVNEKEWLYKGRDSVPWCPRCGTAISQHEILTEEYKELVHQSVYFKLPIKTTKNEYLLAWTTTPWTIPGNVAIAVNIDEEYCGYEIGDEIYWIMKKRTDDLKKKKIMPQDSKVVSCKKGNELVNLEYEGPFDHLERMRIALKGYQHRVVAGDERILPVGSEEGTGLVHVATGAGSEDFRLGKKEKLPVIEIIDDAANYMSGMDDFSGKNAKKHPEMIIDYLKEHQNSRFFLATENYKHRYPTCWRCKTELVWRVVDEWYIAMDRPSIQEGKTYREQMIEVAKKIKWLPKWGLDRELDWLNNMHDWLISKKRYWGLALPIWECKKCKSFEVVGSSAELMERTVEGKNKFDGHSPHRPWIDEIKIKCKKCNSLAKRIQDVGNPWLDAGIVAFSTLSKDWLPADFITESFPGQFKNWFYSLIAMSTAIKNTNSFKTVLGFASVRDEKGEEMHKSKGNAIEFNEAASKIGVDVMRWMYARQDPEQNLNFGYKIALEVKRSFHLILWNVYNFFVTYAITSNFTPSNNQLLLNNVLDKWIMSRLNEVIKKTGESLEKYEANIAALEIENFLNDLSTWYIRRSRDRASVSNENQEDKNDFFETSYFVLVIFSKILAPFVPFISEEIYTNLTKEESVHLSIWPEFDEKAIDKNLEKQMQAAMELSSIIHGARKLQNIKVRIPIKKLSYKGPMQLSEQVKKIVADEVNVYELIFEGINEKNYVIANAGVFDESNLDFEAGEARDMVRKIQEERKRLGTSPVETIDIVIESWPKNFKDYIKKRTGAVSITQGNFQVKRHD